MNIQNGMISKEREEKQFVYNMVIYYQLFNLHVHCIISIILIPILYYFYKKQIIRTELLKFDTINSFVLKCFLDYVKIYFYLMIHFL